MTVFAAAHAHASWPRTSPASRARRVLGLCALAACLLLCRAPSAAHAAGAGVALTVSPVPTVAHPQTATPQVRWSTGDGSPGDVTVAPESGKEILVAAGSEGTVPAPWIAAGHLYVFRLYSTVAGQRLLARLNVGRQAATAEVVALPRKPDITSGFVDRVLQVLAFASMLGLALLTVIHVREARRDG